MQSVYVQSVYVQSGYVQTEYVRVCTFLGMRLRFRSPKRGRQRKGTVAGDYKTEKGKRVGDYQIEKGERVRDYQTEKGERVGDCGLPGSWRADALSWSVVHCIAHLVARI